MTGIPTGPNASRRCINSSGATVSGGFCARFKAASAVLISLCSLLLISIGMNGLCGLLLARQTPLENFYQVDDLATFAFFRLFYLDNVFVLLSLLFYQLQKTGGLFILESRQRKMFVRVFGDEIFKPLNCGRGDFLHIR